MEEATRERFASFPKIPGTPLNRTKNGAEITDLGFDYKLSPHDVLCGRGKDAFFHPGTRRLRELVESHLEEYSKLRYKLDKSQIVTEIVEAIREKTPNGGFVRCVDGRWTEVGDANAREKIGQMFRDALHLQYKSSTRAKTERKRSLLQARQAESSDGSQSSSKSQGRHHQNSKRNITYVRTAPENPRGLKRNISYDRTTTPENIRRLNSRLAQRKLQTSQRFCPTVEHDSEHSVVSNTSTTSQSIPQWERDLASAADDILPPPNPEALRALCLAQIKTVLRIAQGPDNPPARSAARRHG